MRGDTLWDISAKFLKSPWCWPEVWGLNKEQIRDPHWIYPGQIVYFDRASGRLRLGSPVPSTPAVPSNVEPLGTVRLIPQVRSEAIASQAIPTVRLDRIAPFLVRPLVIETASLRDAPVIVATPEGRVYLSRGDAAFVRGDLKQQTRFQAFRPGKALRDPDTGSILSYEARYLGVLDLDRAGSSKDEAHRFLITENRLELGIGDLLVPVPATPLINFAPHPPTQEVSARVMSIYGESTTAGSNDVITINRGSKHGIDIGTVLDISRVGATVKDRTNGNAPIRLPAQKLGTLLIFRVYEQLAYGLVMHSTDAIAVGDQARAPD